MNQCHRLISHHLQQSKLTKQTSTSVPGNKPLWPKYVTFGVMGTNRLGNKDSVTCRNWHQMGCNGPHFLLQWAQTSQLIGACAPKDPENRAYFIDLLALSQVIRSNRNQMATSCKININLSYHTLSAANHVCLYVEATLNTMMGKMILFKVVCISVF